MADADELVIIWQGFHDSLIIIHCHSQQIAEFETWEIASPKDGDGILRWEWDTEGLWLGIMVIIYDI